jgi:hypothetical protein
LCDPIHSDQALTSEGTEGARRREKSQQPCPRNETERKGKRTPALDVVVLLSDLSALHLEREGLDVQRGEQGVVYERDPEIPFFRGWEGT